MYVCTYVRMYIVINVKKILAVINATYTVAKRKPEKNQACRDSNPDRCDTGAAL